MKAGTRIMAICFLAAATLLQAQTVVPKKKSKAIDPDIQALKDAIAAQQTQIQALSQQLQQTNQQLQQTNDQFQQAQQQLKQTQQSASDAAQTVSQQQQAVGTLKSDVAELKTTVDTTASAFQDSQRVIKETQQVVNSQMESPITLRFRGINITPGGYAEGAFVRRSRALTSDVATPFNNLTMPGASQSQTPEFFGSGRQSKSTVFVEGRVGNADLSSYVSADFLSAGVTSTSTSTNGYTLRLRQAWGQLKFDNGWSFLAGQAWSLVTEDAKGIMVDDDMGKTNDVRPKTIDSTYNVGFNFSRQWGFRVSKSFGDKFAAALSIENSQATYTSHSNANNFLVGQPGASNNYNTGSTYSFNPAPDVIAKLAFDPGFGHYEILGVASRFSDRVFPCVDVATACSGGTAQGAYNASKEGGGFGASARWTFAQHVTFGLKGFGGKGVGRYGPAGLPDLSINPDGTINLVKNALGLGTLEFRFNKKFTLYNYGGVEYAGRAYGYDVVQKKYIGYGSPTFANTGCYVETAPGGGTTPGTLANCTGDTRAVLEGTIGFWYKLYSGPKGTFQYGTQYSYVTRNAWSGYGGLPTGSAGRSPNGIDNMIFSSFRYYLP